MLTVLHSPPDQNKATWGFCRERGAKVVMLSVCVSTVACMHAACSLCGTLTYREYMKLMNVAH